MKPDFDVGPNSLFDLDEGSLDMELKYHKLERYHTHSRRDFRDRADYLSYLIQSFELLFRWLPLAMLVPDKIMCVNTRHRPDRDGGGDRGHCAAL